MLQCVVYCCSVLQCVPPFAHVLDELHIEADVSHIQTISHSIFKSSPTLPCDSPYSQSLSSAGVLMEFQELYCHLGNGIPSISPLNLVPNEPILMQKSPIFIEIHTSFSNLHLTSCVTIHFHNINEPFDPNLR